MKQCSQIQKSVSSAPGQMLSLRPWPMQGPGLFSGRVKPGMVWNREVDFSLLILHFNTVKNETVDLEAHHFQE